MAYKFGEKRHECTDPETCPKCLKAARSRVWEAANKNRRRATDRANYAVNKAKVKVERRAFYVANSDKLRALKRAYRRANPDKVKASNQAWLEANRDKNRADCRAYYKAADKDKLRAYNRAYQRVWRKTPAARLSGRLAAARRRAVTTTKELTGAVWGAIQLSWNLCCAYCNHKFGALHDLLAGEDPPVLEIDHLIPVSKGGKHSVFNIVPACRSCNARKSAKDPREFLHDLLAR